METLRNTFFLVPKCTNVSVLSCQKDGVCVMLMQLVWLTVSVC